MKNIYIFFSIFLNICLSNSDTAKKIQSYNYSGGWPINLDKKQLTENFDSANLNCPNGLGCECDKNDDCLNNNCNKNQLRRKGNYCSLKEGDLFYVSNEPHDSWVVGSQKYISLHFLGAESYAN